MQAGLCSSRTQARSLIKEGHVFLTADQRPDVAVKKPSQIITATAQLHIKTTGPRFVSRGGNKLLGAIQTCGLNIEGTRCIDFGQSTGGFTDCLLQLGATSVIGFDVGHDQLHSSLHQHEQVYCYEEVNLKDLNTAYWVSKLKQEVTSYFPVNLAVADLSFISIRRVLPSLLGLLPEQTSCLFLVKPQFELGPSFIGKKGIVKLSPEQEQQLKNDFYDLGTKLGLNPLQFFPSRITGSDGNQEYFLYANWPGSHSAQQQIK